MEKEEGTSQGTCMNDLWTWATERGLTMGVGGGLGRGEQRGENWDNCNRTKIIYLIQNFLNVKN